MFSYGWYLFYRHTYITLYDINTSFSGTTNASMISESAKNRPCLMRTYIRNFRPIFFSTCFYSFILVCFSALFLNYCFSFASTLLCPPLRESHKDKSPSFPLYPSVTCFLLYSPSFCLPLSYLLLSSLLIPSSPFISSFFCHHCHLHTFCYCPLAGLS